MKKDKPREKLSDLEWWDLLKQGNKHALEEIYQSQVHNLLQYGYRFSSDRSLIEDCVHDLFVHLWNHRDGLSSTDSIRRYLLVALRRRILKQLRSGKKIVSKDPVEEFSFQCELSMDEIIIQGEIAKEKKDQIQSAFSQLSPRQREAVYLKYYENLDYQDICKMMDINYQSARNLVFNAIQSMRKFLSIFLWLTFF